MNKQIIKYGAALVAAMFALSSCHWYNYDHGVHYVDHPSHPVVVHHVDHQPRHHKPVKHVKHYAPAPKHHASAPKHHAPAPKHHAPAPKHQHDKNPVFHKDPQHRR